MSPIQAMERSYGALKEMLREGRFAPGFRLEANRLASEMGVSITPVRDALHRLVGERMIDGSLGDGFHVPRPSEADLRELYEWNSALLVIAVRTGRSRDYSLPPKVEDGLSHAALIAMLFDQIGAGSPNREVRAAIASANDRLHPFREIEPRVLDPLIGELEALGNRGPGQLQIIRRYHLRRIRVAPALIRVRSEVGARMG